VSYAFHDARARRIKCLNMAAILLESVAPMGYSSEWIPTDFVSPAKDNRHAVRRLFACNGTSPSVILGACGR